ncbi:HNH endonuclease [Serinibacter salmoneus]|uniref:HNH endonuclease n=1 Tax=Serinibacter salmoneus TaxID=556530 RepID=UPI0014736886|nr:HNH endonuclease signature motif containing protein [Serinibacter salmoneus]
MSRLVEHVDAAEQAGASHDPGAREAATALDAAASILGVQRLRVVGLARRHHESATSGRDREFTSWRANSTKQGIGAARTEEETGRTLARLSTIREAAGAGTVSEGHVRAIAGVLERAPENVRDRLMEREGEILRRAQEATVPDLRKELRAAAAALEADQADRDFEVARQNRRLFLINKRGGVAVEGFLDAVAGATLRTALEAVTQAPTAEDQRTAEQRRADGLLAIAERTLSQGVTRPGAQIRPTLTVLIRHDAWLLLLARRRQACPKGPEGIGSQAPAADGRSTRRTGEAFARSRLRQEPALAELLDGTLIPFAALEVMACDAFTQRVVLDPQGAPLDVGRTQRTFTGDLRRAILVRDRHCQYPGCSMRASWCEVHHILYWSRQGATSQENGITLCSAHHHQVHDERLTITPIAGGFQFTTPSGRRIGRTTRLHDHLLIPAAELSFSPVRAAPRSIPSPHGDPPVEPSRRVGALRCAPAQPPPGEREPEGPRARGAAPPRTRAAAPALW